MTIILVFPATINKRLWFLKKKILFFLSSLIKVWCYWFWYWPLSYFLYQTKSQDFIGEPAMIINTDEIKNIYVSKQFCDMRKQIDGLALIVTSQFNMNVLDHSLFIFTNASRNRIKMLYYEANGFWLFTRRLENGKFKFKRHEESDSWKLNLEQKIQS